MREVLNQYLKERESPIKDNILYKKYHHYNISFWGGVYYMWLKDNVSQRSFYFTGIHEITSTKNSVVDSYDILDRIGYMQFELLYNSNQYNILLWHKNNMVLRIAFERHMISYRNNNNTMGNIATKLRSIYEDNISNYNIILQNLLEKQDYRLFNLIMTDLIKNGIMVEKFDLDKENLVHDNQIKIEVSYKESNNKIDYDILDDEELSDINDILDMENAEDI